MCSRYFLIVNLNHLNLIINCFLFFIVVVYAGWYKPAEENKEIIAVTSDEATENCKKWTIGERVPMVLIVKCGNEEERDPAKKVSKPGNRGKRDSQLVLMTFLSRVLFDERLTEFEYDLYRKMWLLTGVRPDAYETVLMVDADTIGTVPRTLLLR